jgi:hypothetical protein
MQLFKVWFFQSTLTSSLLSSNTFLSTLISNVFLLCLPLEWDLKFYVQIKEYVHVQLYVYANSYELEF